MTVTMDDSIKRWTARRKTALVVKIIQGKSTMAEAKRAYDLPHWRCQSKLLERTDLAS